MTFSYIVFTKHIFQTTSAASWNKSLSRGLFSSQLTAGFQNVHIQKASFFKKALEEDVKDMDPRKGKLIYVGSLSKFVKIVKAFSVSSSIVCLGMQPYLYIAAQESALPVFAQVLVGGFFNFFIFVTPLALHWITKRYLINMHYNSVEQKYYGTSYSFFVRPKEHSFKREDVRVPSIAGVFTTFEVNGKPLFADPPGFFNKEDYIKLMKYDEPVQDWKLPSFDEEISRDGKESEFSEQNSKTKQRI